MMPCTVPSADSASRRAAIASPSGWSRVSTRQAIPTFAAARSIERTYQAVASSSVGTTTAKVGVVPDAVRAAAAAVTSALISVAMARPSMSLTR